MTCPVCGARMERVERTSEVCDECPECGYGEPVNRGTEPGNSYGGGPFVPPSGNLRE